MSNTTLHITKPNGKKAIFEFSNKIYATSFLTGYILEYMKDRNYLDLEIVIVKENV